MHRYAPPLCTAAYARRAAMGGTDMHRYAPPCTAAMHRYAPPLCAAMHDALLWGTDMHSYAPPAMHDALLRGYRYAPLCTHVCTALCSASYASMLMGEPPSTRTAVISQLTFRFFGGGGGGAADSSALSLIRSRAHRCAFGFWKFRSSARELTMNVNSPSTSSTNSLNRRCCFLPVGSGPKSTTTLQACTWTSHKRGTVSPPDPRRAVRSRHQRPRAQTLN